MFDFHTHILPGVDDGSHSVEESVSMLSELYRQGVDGVALTPHFYAETMSPEEFFKCRQSAWEKLKPHLSAEMPEIRLGAEVYYFEGINRYEGLESFCIEGTRLLLLEMPECSWTNRMISAIIELNSNENITVLMAHIERYLTKQKKEVWKLLLNSGVRMQASADFFAKRSSRREAMKLMRNGSIHLLGTDCHNMTTRKPDMAEAKNAIVHSKGEDLLARMKRREEMLLSEMNSFVAKI